MKTTSYFGIICYYFGISTSDFAVSTTYFDIFRSDNTELHHENATSHHIFAETAYIFAVNKPLNRLKNSGNLAILVGKRHIRGERTVDLCVDLPK